MATIKEYVKLGALLFEQVQVMWQRSKAQAARSVATPPAAAPQQQSAAPTAAAAAANEIVTAIAFEASGELAQPVRVRQQFTWIQRGHH